MSLQNIKQIVLNIPKDGELPSITEFTIEENLLMLQIGSDAIIASKKGITETNIMEVLKEEIKREYQKKMNVLKTQLHDREQEAILQTRLLEVERTKTEDEIDKRTTHQIEKYEYINKHAQEEIERMRTTLNEKETELHEYKTENLVQEVEVKERIERETNTKIQEVLKNTEKTTTLLEKTIENYENQQKTNSEEMGKIREQNKTLYEKLSETEKELVSYKEKSHSIHQEADYRIEKEINAKMKTEYEELKKTIQLFKKEQTQTTNNVSIGDKGENIFEEYAAKTFRDFEEFEIKNVSTKYYKGDFHLHFKRFSIMVDTKYYSNGIDKSQRDKLRHDLQQNQHIRFGWIVSLDSSINKFNKAPFQFEWTAENQCICYINHFLKNQDPCETLRSIWFACNLIFDIAMNNETEMNEINKLKKNETRIKEIVEKLVKVNKERDLTVNQLKENFEMADKCIREILNVEINTVFENHYEIVHKWWDSKIEKADDNVLTINRIYKEFKKEDENMEKTISEDYFKTIVYSFIDEKTITKSKKKGGKVEIANINWKIA